MISGISNTTSQFSTMPSTGSDSLTKNLQGKSTADQSSFLQTLNQQSSSAAEANSENNAELKKQFSKFVGGTFFRQMLTEMQKSVGKPAFMHGGQAEEMFRSELNSKLADQMAESTGDSFAGPMFELFNLQRAS